MASLAVGPDIAPQAGALLLGCVAERGTASHGFAKSDSVTAGAEAVRNLADLVHYLCALHGRYPGMVELAAERVLEGPGRRWLVDAAPAFAAERGFLARLAVAAGPVPATPGTGPENPIATQRAALDTLGRSERRGCALGAALAFAVEWHAIRHLLVRAAERFGMNVPPSPVRSADEIAALADAVDADAGTPSVRRAMLFGAEQVALQHRAMWDLLQARAQARTA